jgi:hypothetical protein
MLTVLILFFGSLVCIVAMIWRKMSLVREIQSNETERFLLNIDIPDLEEIKHITVRRIKSYGYNVLVTTMRIYIVSSHFLRKTSKELYRKAKNKLNRNANRPTGELGEKHEVSGFLKRISEYKEKIRTIKHRIKKEENIE